MLTMTTTTFTEMVTPDRAMSYFRIVEPKLDKIAAVPPPKMRTWIEVTPQAKALSRDSKQTRASQTGGIYKLRKDS
jgi:hypothetical protein